MRLRVRYSGRVQGVGFRATCRSIAGRAEVSGWVRNESDGSVVMEVQGDEAEVAKVLAEISQAMRRNIAHADEMSVPEVERESGFEITR